jgi:hypothetical protein
MACDVLANPTVVFSNTVAMPDWEVSKAILPEEPLPPSTWEHETKRQFEENALALLMLAELAASPAVNVMP